MPASSKPTKGPPRTPHRQTTLRFEDMLTHFEPHWELTHVKQDSDKGSRKIMPPAPCWLGSQLYHCELAVVGCLSHIRNNVLEHQVDPPPGLCNVQAGSLNAASTRLQDTLHKPFVHVESTNKRVRAAPGPQCTASESALSKLLWTSFERPCSQGGFGLRPWGQCPL
jgi:hypothetical protein